MSAAPAKTLGPGNRRIRADIGDTRQSAADRIAACAQPLGVDPHADAKHQLVAFGLGLHRLGGELRLGGDERDLGWNCDVWINIQHDLRIRSKLDFTRLLGWQVNVHVDITDIQHGEDFAHRLVITSPTLAIRYWMRPSRGATSVLSAMLTV